MLLQVWPVHGAAESGGTLFSEYVSPTLRAHCASCHNSQLKKGGLDLSSRDAMLQGGDSGPAILPGKSAESLLYQLITRQRQPAMPYKSDPLPREAVEQIARWIDAGATFGEAQGRNALFAEVRPVLESNCLPCHGGKSTRGGLDLSTREALLRGGDDGPVVVAGQSRQSVLYKRIRHEVQPGMPFQRPKLSGTVIARIAQWIDDGAPYDAPLRLRAGAEAVSKPLTNHWAFRTPRSLRVPSVRNSGWVRNPVDAFIAAEHEKRGLKPLPPADKHTLLRRVYLDLIGLPPTPEEMRSFLADTSADAYEKVVDRLLADRRYGERWGRHWMDIWRYSDWYGRRALDDQRNSARHIWHWRDWIIESLNQDKGYDRMILEMLAGDEVAPADPSVLRATGFLARDFYRFNRNVWLQDTVENTAAAFLGVTMKCARCHDHKYDPISQEEYYRLRAFFEPYDVRIDRVPIHPDVNQDGLARVYDAEPREATTQAPFIPAIYAKTYRLIRGDERNPDKTHELKPGVPEVLGGTSVEVHTVSLPLEAYDPDLRGFVERDLIDQAKSDIQKSQAALATARLEMEKARQAVAQPAPVQPSGPVISFGKEIRPVLEKNCFTCHSAKAAKSGLVVESIESLLDGGTRSGAAVIAGNSRDSPLTQYLRGEKQPRMPYGTRPLPAAEIARIAQWIDQLPPEPPQARVRKATERLRLAELRLEAQRASLPALEARLAADRAKAGSATDSKRVEDLAKVAQGRSRTPIDRGRKNICCAPRSRWRKPRLPARKRVPRNWPKLASVPKRRPRISERRPILTPRSPFPIPERAPGAARHWHFGSGARRTR